MPRQRLRFPIKGATDRPAYQDVPEGYAPLSMMLNVRPRDVLEGRERGGQRPGLMGVADAAGTVWPQLGEGPIQAIAAIERPARIQGYEIGACREAFEEFDPREGATTLEGTLYVAKGLRSTRPGFIRNADIGDALSFVGRGGGSELYIESARFYGDNLIFGGVNELPGREAGSTSEHFLFKARWAAGRPGGGWGSPQWTEIQQTGLPSDGATPVLPYPCESVAAFLPSDSYGGTFLNGVGFAAVTNSVSVNGTRDWGYIAAFDLTADTNQLITSVHPRFEEIGPGAGDPANPNPVPPANPGAHEVRAIKKAVVGGRPFLYFTYRAAPMAYSKVGRFDVNAFTTSSGTFGYDGLNGAVQVDGANLTFFSANYPRGCTPGDVSVAPDGSVYYTRSSTGWGPRSDGTTVNDEHPLFPARTPITVVKINAAGDLIVWEVGWRQTGNPIFDGLGVREPEATCCAADDEGVYVGSHDGYVAKLASADGRILWQKRAASGNAIEGVEIDPEDGNPIFAGGGSLVGESPSEDAFVFKVDRSNGRVLWRLAAPGSQFVGRCVDVHTTRDLLLIGKFAK